MSKLSSRTKLKKTIKKSSQQTIEDLNSSDDFVQIPAKVVKKKCVEKIENISNNSSTNNHAEESSSVFPSSVISSGKSSNSTISSSSQKATTDPRQNCPFCKKSFKTGQESTRLSHLKSCGTLYGLSTEKILEAHRLIERQDEEWKILELNLPKSAANTTTTKNRTKNCTSRAQKNSRMKTTELQLSSDPQYDLAIALSKSMANGDMTKPESPQKCWLPQPPPIPVKQSLKSKAKTALQVRTDSDRAQQITGEL